MKKITKTVRMLEGRVGITGTRCTEVGVCVCVSVCSLCKSWFIKIPAGWNRGVLSLISFAEKIIFFHFQD